MFALFIWVIGIPESFLEPYEFFFNQEDSRLPSSDVLGKESCPDSYCTGQDGFPLALEAEFLYSQTLLPSTCTHPPLLHPLASTWAAYYLSSPPV